MLCPIDVVDGYLITKELRQKLFGRVAGGCGSRNPEDYQRKKIIEGTGYSCRKTNMRINSRNITLVQISQPNKFIDGFDYTEDFDGVQNIENNTIYINMKSIVGKGGSQTRSLREVKHFIVDQMNILNKYADEQPLYFANIIDGDEAHACMDKLKYNVQPIELEHRIYIGDLKGYFQWCQKTFLDK